MSKGFYFLIAVVPILSSAIEPTTEKWTWIFYRNGLTSWNDGHEHCSSINGRLLNLATDSRGSVLDHFKKNDWSSYFNDHMWIGLYYKSGTKAWQGLCHDLYSNSGYNNWKSGEMIDNGKPCTMVDKGSLEWSMEVCKQQYVVICEINQGPCSFDVFTSSCHIDRDTTIPRVVSSLTECQELCLTWMLSNKECWAVTYFESTGECFGTFDINPFRVHKSNLLQSPCQTVYSTVSNKICFEAAVSTESLSYSYSNNEKVITPSCYTTTSSTTTTTPTTTTTTPTTTTTTPTTTTTTPTTTTTTMPLSTTITLTTTEEPTTTTTMPTTSITSTTKTSTTHTTTATTLTATTTASTTSMSTTMMPTTAKSIPETTTTAMPTTTSSIMTTLLPMTGSPSSEATQYDVKIENDASTTSLNDATSGILLDTKTTDQPSSFQTITTICNNTNTCTTNVNFSDLDYSNNVTVTASTLGVCSCNCLHYQNVAEVTSPRKELLIDRRSTSKWLRTKSCADDERISAKTIGWSGAALLIGLLSVIVISDIHNLISSLQNKKNEYLCSS